MILLQVIGIVFYILLSFLGVKRVLPTIENIRKEPGIVVCLFIIAPFYTFWDILRKQLIFLWKILDALLHLPSGLFLSVGRGILYICDNWMKDSKIEEKNHENSID